MCFSNASSARPHEQPASLSPWDAPNSRDRHGQFPTRGVVDRATWWIVLLDRHKSHPTLLTSSVPNTGWIAPTSRAAPQAPGPMLRSSSTKTRCASHEPGRMLRTGLTQALEPMHVWVSLAGWRVRGSVTDLTVSARRAR